jgi:pilus biogenesis lipoprotein CpaD
MATMRPLLALSAFIALGACAPQWSELESPKANRVSLITFTHTVSYDRSGERASPQEAGRFLAFLDRVGLDYGDEVALASGDELGQRRAGVLAAELRRRGLTPVLRNESAEGSRVVVTVNRHVVTPPSCPDWTRAPGDFTNLAAANFGCATATNLGMMVAAPGDLVQGRAAPRADGDAAVLAIQRYRSGKMRSLPDSDISTTDAKSGGGQ